MALQVLMFLAILSKSIELGDKLVLFSQVWILAYLLVCNTYDHDICIRFIF